MTQPEPTSWSRKKTRKYFIAEKVAMHANGPWTVGDIMSTNPGLPFAVAPLPVAPDREPFEPIRVTQVITDHLVMPATCGDRDLMMRFVRFVYQDRYRQRFCEPGMAPEKRSVAHSDFFQDAPAWRIFVEIIPDGKPIPLMKCEPIELAAQQMLHDVFTGRNDVRSALDELAAVMDAEVASQAPDEQGEGRGRQMWTRARREEGSATPGSYRPLRGRVPTSRQPHPPRDAPPPACRSRSGCAS